MVEKNNIENTFNLAEKNHKQNNLIEAKNLYESILKIEPNHLNSIFQKIAFGRLYVSENMLRKYLISIFALSCSKQICKQSSLSF